MYYPSSGSDYAPSIAFPNSLVVYADGNEYSMDALKKKRLAAYHEDVTCFDTRKIISEINLLLLFNPVVSFSEIEKNLNLRGYVLCNDYHGNATELGRRSDFEFL